MTPEQQLRAVQIKTQQVRDLPAWGLWHVGGLVAMLIAGSGVIAMAIVLIARFMAT
jgi:hypothetical protein